jgi:hypothetical protein
MTRRLPATLGLLALALAPAAGETRYHQHCKKAKGSDGGVQAVAATYFGGPGAEAFVAAGIAADGSVVAVGNAWGPAFPKTGNPAVIGTDRFVQADIYDKKKRLNHANPNVAAFVVRYAPGLDGIRSVVRMGWGNASASHATIASDGTVYLSGRCSEALRAAVGAKAEIVPPPDGKGKGSDLYLAALPPKASAPAWVKIFERAEEASNRAERHVRGQPGVRALQRGAGEIVLVAHGRLYALDLKTKKLREVAPMKGGVLHAVDADGNAYLGGDENSNTGREPWRKPFLYKVDRAGKVLWEVWRWNSKTVGTDKYRLVSDSSVRHVGFAQGRMVVSGWSDGGNSVFNRQPTDLDANLKYKGFIDSLWGAGVGTFSRLMLLENDPPKLLEGSIWCSFLTSKNKPNSAAIDAMEVLADGRVVVGGGSSFALVETPDAWVKTFPEGTGGANVSILSADLKDLLFSTTLPTAERTVALGSAGTRLILACRAKAAEADDARKPVLVKPLQPKVAGAWDGYLLLVETKGETYTEKAEREKKEAEVKSGAGSK